MKNYFNLQTLVSVLVALLVFEFAKRMFLDKAIEKIAPAGNYEDYERVDNYNDDDDDEN